MSTLWTGMINHNSFTPCTIKFSKYQPNHQKKILLLSPNL